MISLFIKQSQVYTTLRLSKTLCAKKQTSSFSFSDNSFTKVQIANSLPNNKILDWSKLKAFAVDKNKVLKMMLFVFNRVEKIVGKRENAGYQHFLLFPQSFQKSSFPGLFKVGFVIKS